MRGVGEVMASSGVSFTNLSTVPSKSASVKAQTLLALSPSSSLVPSSPMKTDIRPTPGRTRLTRSFSPQSLTTFAGSSLPSVLCSPASDITMGATIS